MTKQMIFDEAVTMMRTYGNLAADATDQGCNVDTWDDRATALSLFTEKLIGSGFTESNGDDNNTAGILHLVYLNHKYRDCKYAPVTYKNIAIASDYK